ncbi:MAG TPA: hypothetical protein DDW65_12775 [Firmicutes bacterium]|jgi:hypothetical protein|nr:hypothetical protein [Bacillota bacterium]
MRRLRSMIGYLWALLALPIIVATFMGNDYWAGHLVAVTGIKVSPWFTGGNVNRIVHHGQYQTILHRAVFDGLIWQRSRGFVQINWKPVKLVSRTLPEEIHESIDYDHDGVVDFQIQLNTKTDHAELVAPKSYVLGIQSVYQLKNEKAVRVLLRNKNKEEEQ